MLIILTMVFLSVLVTSFTSYMSARQLIYPLQDGSYQAYTLANAGVELAIRYARDNITTFLPTPNSIIPTQSGPCTSSSTWRTVTIAGSGSPNTINLCYDSTNNNLHSVGKAMDGSKVVAMREVKLSDFMGYVASGCAVDSSAGCHNKAVFSQVPGQPLYLAGAPAADTLTQPTFANINGYSSAFAFGIEVSWVLAQPYCSNPDIDGISINGTTMPSATYDVNHNGTWNPLPITNPQGSTTYRIKFQNDTPAAGGRWDMGLTFAAAPAAGTYTITPVVQTTGAVSSWSYNNKNYRDITQSSTTYAGGGGGGSGGGGSLCTGDITVTNKTGITLYYKSSGPCTAWAPDTVTLTHSVGQHLRLWLDNTCHANSTCDTDYNFQLAMDNACNGNCKTKIVMGAVPGLPVAYQCVPDTSSPTTILSFVDN